MKDPEQTPKSKRWMIMLGVVVLAFLLYYLASFMTEQRGTDSDQRQNPPPHSSINQGEPTTSQVDQNQSPASSIDTSLLTAPVPQDSTLAQEEISRLQDQQAQLTDRKELLEQQLQDSDKLVELKEQYIADLQTQLGESAA
ncbi:hypothetical protein ACF3NA_08760 [Alkanindiges sp. WGS2144]|uniref:hypothetical protein n=1 Tax=Alkanindiges sp. WGS2144 TaxID=3366808 RepID=UPI003751E7AF